MEWMVATWAASLRAKRWGTERRARPTAGTFLVSKHLTWGERERERERERGVSGGGGVREGRRRRGGAHARAGGPRTGLAPGWRGGGDHLASASALARARARGARLFFPLQAVFLLRTAKPSAPRAPPTQLSARAPWPAPSPVGPPQADFPARRGAPPRKQVHSLLGASPAPGRERSWCRPGGGRKPARSSHTPGQGGRRRQRRPSGRRVRWRKGRARRVRERRKGR